MSDLEIAKETVRIYFELSGITPKEALEIAKSLAKEGKVSGL